MEGARVSIVLATKVILVRWINCPSVPDVDMRRCSHEKKTRLSIFLLNLNFRAIKYLRLRCCLPVGTCSYTIQCPHETMSTRANVDMRQCGHEAMST